MQLDRDKLNRKGKLSHLLADDMFSEDIKQVFNAKTGAYAGYIKDGKTVIAEEPEETQPEEEKKNPDQLSLF